MADMKELRAKEPAALRADLESMQRALFALRVGMANQAAAKTSNLGKLRREIAQVKTVMREKHGAAPAAAAEQAAAPAPAEQQQEKSE
ncbi:MAG: 50S ribosomal protein L29 [Betaproteobacteria bacterium AqS2]|uniref:Large ribosomal subunit protein uL29 n=1 Tax=Candidatus Amphirhobacter heronislandensis TaxID=1732024 RepID=A0A930XWZ5_9GAMM|nr:50S ribosomal protein L29 [Betaproteobacteria bacterium AqS2]